MALCVSVCEWVSVRLWGVRICVSLSGSGASLCVWVTVGPRSMSLRVSLRLCVWFWVPLLSVRVSGRLGTCVQVSVSRAQCWWVWPNVDPECVSLCECLCPRRTYKYPLSGQLGSV